MISANVVLHAFPDLVGTHLGGADQLIITLRSIIVRSLASCVDLETLEECRLLVKIPTHADHVFNGIGTKSPFGVVWSYPKFGHPAYVRSQDIADLFHGRQHHPQPPQNRRRQRRWAVLGRCRVSNIEVFFISLIRPSERLNRQAFPLVPPPNPSLERHHKTAVNINTFVGAGTASMWKLRATQPALRPHALHAT